MPPRRSPTTDSPRASCRRCRRADIAQLRFASPAALSLLAISGALLASAIILASDTE